MGQVTRHLAGGTPGRGYGVWRRGPRSGLLASVSHPSRNGGASRDPSGATAVVMDSAEGVALWLPWMRGGGHRGLELEAGPTAQQPSEKGQ